MTNFFVSYNRADKAWAEWIAWILEDAGHNTIIQAWDFRPGGNFVLDMDKASKTTDKTLVILSEDYLNAEFTQPEWATAFADDPKSLARKIIPIRVRDCQPRGLLRPIVYVDLVGLESDAARQAILDALPERLKPETEPLFPRSEMEADKKTPLFPIPSISTSRKLSHDRNLTNQDAQKPELDHIPVDLPALNENPIGRNEELAHIHLALQKVGRAVVTGMPGVGKSLTALQYADSHAEQYPGGVFWIDGGDGDLEFQIIETAIEQDVTIPNNISVKRHLRYCAKNWPRAPYPVLFILDNVDTQAALEACLKWMPADRFKLLITARPQLQIPQVETIALSPLSPDKALTLIEEILPSNDPRLVDEDKRAELMELCGTFLGGLPLALQIVGQALRDETYLSIADLNKQLRTVENPFDGSWSANVDTAGMLDNVRQSVLAVFELSWQALTVESQILGGLISLFAPTQIPWSLIQEAAQHIDSLTNPAGACAKLRQASLLRRTDRDQFQMHRLLRRFFQLKVQALPDISDSKHKALLAMCRKIPERCSQLEAQDFISVEPHVTAAIREGKEALEFYQALQCYFLGRGLYGQAYLWAVEAIKHHQKSGVNNQERLAYLHKLAGERAHLAVMTGDALKHLQMARDLLQDQPNSKLMAQVMVVLAALQREIGQLDEAEVTSQTALKLCQEHFAADSLEMAEAKLTQATVKYVHLRQPTASPSRLDLEALEALAQEVIHAREQCCPENGGSQAEAINLLAKIYELMGQPDRALPLYRRAVVLTKSPHPDAAIARNNLAKALESCMPDEGTAQQIEELYDQAIDIFDKAEMLGNKGWCQHNLGLFYAAQGRIEDGIALVDMGYMLLQQEEHPLAGMCKDHLTALQKPQETGYESNNVS